MSRTHAVDVVQVARIVAIASLFLASTVVAVNVNALVLNVLHVLVHSCGNALVLNVQHVLNVHHVPRYAIPVLAV